MHGQTRLPGRPASGSRTRPRPPAKNPSGAGTRAGGAVGRHHLADGKNPARASAGGPAHRNHRPGGRRNRRLRGGGGAGATRQAGPGGKPGDRSRRTAAPGITRDPVVAQTTTGDHRTAAPAQCRRSRPRGRDQHRHALSVARGTGIRGRPDGGRERPSGPR
jgi:hypothetical protein